LTILGRCLFEKKDEKFLKFFESSISKDPKNLYIWLNLGDICNRENRLEAAEHAFLKAEELLKEEINDSFQVFGNLSLIYLKMKNYKKALKYTQQALQLNNESPSMFLIQGRALFENNDLKSSTIALSKSLVLSPKQPLGSISIYRCHYKLEEWENAESDLWTEKSVLISDHSFVLYQLAVFAFESQMPKPSYKLIQQAIHLNPTRKEYWNFMNKNKFK
jgi:tetratricopeptide (TPR) repeat protein